MVNAVVVGSSWTGSSADGQTVGGLQVGEQDAPGDAVDRQVMGGQEELCPRVRLGQEQGGAQQGAGGGIEVRAGGVGCRGERGVPSGAGGPGHVVPDQEAGRHGVDGLLVPGVAGTDEPGAQRGMVGGHGVQGPFQGVRVEVVRQVEQHRHAEVPQRSVGGEEPLLDGGERGRPRVVRPLRRGRRGGAQLHGGGQLGDGLVQEDVPGGQAQSGGAGPGDRLDAEDRVAAELEEVVGDPHPRDAEHRGPDPGQFPFGGGTRRHELPLARGRFEVGGGQRAAVQLAAGGQRQGVQDDEGRGHHMAGQGALKGRPQLGGGGAPGPGGGHQVGGEPGVAALVGDGDDGGPGDGRQGRERRLDLAGLDAVAADLDLVVGAAEVVEPSVGGPAGQVAGAVHPAAGRPERVRHEPRGAQAGAVQIAAGDLVARPGTAHRRHRAAPAGAGGRGRGRAHWPAAVPPRAARCRRCGRPARRPCIRWVRRSCTRRRRAERRDPATARGRRPRRPASAAGGGGGGR